MEVTIERATRILEAQRRANRKYYEKNKELVKERATAYWEQHRDAINERRRFLYQTRRRKPQPNTDGRTEQGLPGH